MTATNKHSLISCYTNTLFGNALCLVKTSHTHSTYAHIYAHTRFFMCNSEVLWSTPASASGHDQPGSCSAASNTHSLSRVEIASMPEHVHPHPRSLDPCRNADHAQLEQNSRKGTSPSKNSLVDSQLLQHFFWKPSVKELRVQSLSPSQFSDIKYVIHVQE